MQPESLSTRAFASRSCLLALGWFAITAGLFGVGEFVAHSHAVTDVDRHITNWVVDRRTPALDATMKVVTWIGSWVAVAITGGVVLALTVAKYLTRAALLLFVVAWAGEYATVNSVKHLVGRPRPPRALWLVTARGASFPSGHAANATLVGAAAVSMALLLTRRRSFRASATTLGFLAIAVVGFSRVELGVHWTTDVLAGGLVTLVWLGAVAWLFARTVPLAVPRSGPDEPGIRRHAV